MMDRSLTLATLALFTLAGCGSSASSTPDALVTGSPDAGAGCNTIPDAGCPATGTGTLVISVEGLPAEATPMVTVSGPSGAVPYAPSMMVGGGSYTVAALRVAAPDPLVRRAFVPSV